MSMQNRIDMAIEPKSDQLNYDDFLIEDKTITITDVKGSSKTNDQQPVTVNFHGDNGKPFKPCKSMRRVMVRVWGGDARQYIGKSMTLYGDPDVVFGGQKVGGIRISHMSHIDKEIMVTLSASKTKRIPYRVKPLKLNMEVPNEVDNDNDPTAIIQAAEEAATQGMDRLRNHYDNLPANEQSIVKKELARLKGVASEVDKKASDFDDETDDFDEETGEVTEQPEDDETKKLDFYKDLYGATNETEFDAAMLKHKDYLEGLKKSDPEEYSEVNKRIQDKELELTG